MEDLKKKKSKYDKNYYLKNKVECIDYDKTYYWKNRESVLARQKRLRDYWKHEMVKHFGGGCQRCGFSDVRALQIDHVNGG